MRPIRLLILIVSAAAAGGWFSLWLSRNYEYSPKPAYDSFEQNQQAKYGFVLPDSAVKVPQGMNFTLAAKIVRPAVVHVKTYYESGSVFHQFRGNPDEEPEGGPNGNPNDYYDYAPEASGSGVIISDDGYIVTNHHVV